REVEHAQAEAQQQDGGGRSVHGFGMRDEPDEPATPQKVGIAYAQRNKQYQQVDIANSQMP
ncbi:MAG TPA: hypothetical protein VF217_06405, partial [Rhodanobacteraceae bacterium]